MSDEIEKREREARRKEADKQIGARLRAAREMAKLTQAAASEVLGYEKAQIGHIEKGIRFIRASDIGDLAKRYGESCDWLILGKRSDSMSLDATRLLELFSQLKDNDRKLTIEFAEDRLERAKNADSRKSDAA